MHISGQISLDVTAGLLFFHAYINEYIKPIE